MKSACVGVLSIVELKNARWNIENSNIKFHENSSRGMRIVPLTDGQTDMTKLIVIFCTFTKASKKCLGIPPKRYACVCVCSILAQFLDWEFCSEFRKVSIFLDPKEIVGRRYHAFHDLFRNSYLCHPMYWSCVLYHCHRVLTQLQSTNISI